MRKMVLWRLGMGICASASAGFLQSKNPTKCPHVNVNSHLYQIISTYYPDITNAAADSKEISRFDFFSRDRTLDDYRRNVRQFGIAITGKRDKKRVERDLDEYRYIDNFAHPLVWTSFLEKPEILRSYMARDAALRDVAVAIGLTRPYVQYRRYAVGFADKSILNYPVLALRVPFGEAKQYLAPHPQYRRLLDAFERRVRRQSDRFN